MAEDKETKGGIVALIPLDKSKLHEMYPMVAASCDMFEAAHPSLPDEMYNHPQKYIKELNEKAYEFCKHLLNETQLFHRYYELASYIDGLLIYKEFQIYMLSRQLEEIKKNTKI